MTACTSVCITNDTEVHASKKVVTLQAEVKNFSGRQGHQSRVFLMFGFRPLTVSRHLLDQLPILHMPHTFENVDNVTTGSSSPSALSYTIPEVSKLLRAWILRPKARDQGHFRRPPQWTDRQTDGQL